MIGELEGNFRAQSDVDSAYNNLCGLIKSKMFEKLLTERLR